MIIIYDEPRTCINWVEFTSIAFYRRLFLYCSAYFDVHYPPPPPRGNLAMNESRISWLEHVYPVQAYRLGSYPMVQGPGGLKETKMFLPHPLLKLSIAGSLRDREVECSASDLQGLNFESCVWRAVSSHSSHHPQEVLLAQFILYVHKSGLKPDLFHFYTKHIRIAATNHCHMDGSTTGLIDRRAQTLIGQHLPPTSLVSYDLILTVLFYGI